MLLNSDSHLKASIYEDDEEANQSMSNEETIQVKAIPKSKLWNYVNEHSLLIFKYNSKFRQHLLRLVMPSEDIIPQDK